MPVVFLKIVDSDVDLDTNGCTVTKNYTFSIENNWLLKWFIF